MSRLAQNIHLVVQRLRPGINHTQPRSKMPENITSACFQPRCYSKSSGRSDETETHSVRRAQRGDTKDPAAAAVASGMEERADYEGIADQTKSGATTQRGGSKHAAKSKREHPAAPEPIIGMNDERGQKGH